MASIRAHDDERNSDWPRSAPPKLNMARSSELGASLSRVSPYSIPTPRGKLCTPRSSHGWPRSAPPKQASRPNSERGNPTETHEYSIPSATAYAPAYAPVTSPMSLNPSTVTTPVPGSKGPSPMPQERMSPASPRSLADRDFGIKPHRRPGSEPPRLASAPSLKNGCSTSILSTSSSRHSAGCQTKGHSSRRSSRAVLVAATYNDTKGVRPLPNDIEHLGKLFQLLTQKLRFQPEDVWVLTDSTRHITGCIKRLAPSRTNLLHAMKWLVGKSREHDQLFFAFSGLGTETNHQKDSKKATEDCILPTDFPLVSPILQSEIAQLLVKALHIGASLTMLFDARDARILRLPFVNCADRQSRLEFAVKEVFETDDDRSELFRNAMSRASLWHGKMRREYMEMRQQEAEDQRDALAADFSRRGSVVSFGGCRDSLEINRGRSMRPLRIGALTTAFVDYITHSLATRQPVTYRSVLLNLAPVTSRKRDSQLLQVSSTKKLNLDEEISLLKHRAVV